MNTYGKGVDSLPTPTMVDYIEQTYALIASKGYGRVTDLAEALVVHPSTVTKMIQKLDKENFVHYEKYSGFILTEKGTKIGKRLVFRHDLLEEFLELIGVDEANIYDDVEGIEHHLSWNAIDRIADLVTYFKEDEQRIRALQQVQDQNEDMNIND